MRSIHEQETIEPTFAYPTNSGYNFFISSSIISHNSALHSIPVGPPPTTAKFNNIFFISSLVVGKLAVSKQLSNRLRIFLASATSFKKYACSRTPFVPKVCE